MKGADGVEGGHVRLKEGGVNSGVCGFDGGEEGVAGFPGRGVIVEGEGVGTLLCQGEGGGAADAACGAGYEDDFVFGFVGHRGMDL